MTPRVRALLGWGAAAVCIVLFFVLIGRRVPDHSRAVHVTKAALALAAAGLFFYERAREGMRRPISERWKKFVGITIGIASIILYFNGFKLGYVGWYHRHDQFHYYMGAKYFRELGYSNLYRCAAIAQDEAGTVIAEGRKLDLTKEVRHADRKLRDLGNTNLLINAGDVLADPGSCKNAFSESRWEMFKKDIVFFRSTSDKGYWEGMQKDHGYNPPPVWTLGGMLLATLAPASTFFQQFLAALDVFYMLGMLGALAWAFGWRVFAVGAVLWGLEGAADPYYWTGGAFLRQDWLFFTVLSVCLARKKWFALAGASIVYAALLRVFPGVLVLGALVVAGTHLAKHRRMAPHHLRMLIGGFVGGVLLIGASVAVVGKDSYKAFYKHTIVVHDRTPLTNHMGLRVMIAHKPGKDVKSGRMKYTRDEKLVDPFEVWKRMRTERYAKFKWLAYGLDVVLFGAFVYVVRRVKSLWMATGLSVIWVIMLTQLTNYYYGFLVCAVPLIKAKKWLELVVYGYCFVTQVVFLTMYWNDDKYTAQTFLALLFSALAIAAFWPPRKPVAATSTAGAPATRAQATTS